MKIWTTPLIAASGAFVGAVLACYQVTGDWLAPGSAVEGHLGYVASVTGAFGAVSGIAGTTGCPDFCWKREGRHCRESMLCGLYLQFNLLRWSIFVGVSDKCSLEDG